MTTKKFISFLLVAIMVISIIPFAAFAKNNKLSENREPVYDGTGITSIMTVSTEEGKPGEYVEVGILCEDAGDVITGKLFIEYDSESLEIESREDIKIGTSFENADFSYIPTEYESGTITIECASSGEYELEDGEMFIIRFHIKDNAMKTFAKVYIDAEKTFAKTLSGNKDLVFVDGGVNIVSDDEYKIYKVSFIDGLTNEIIETQEVEQGGAAIAPEAPMHEGYIFMGWDKDFTNVTENIVVTARYRKVGTALITVSTEEERPSGYVEVKISCEDAKDVYSGLMFIRYDSKLLEIESRKDIKKGTSLENADFSIVVNNNEPGTIMIAYTSEGKYELQDGEMFIIRFHINDNAPRAFAKVYIDAEETFAKTPSGNKDLVFVDGGVNIEADREYEIYTVTFIDGHDGNTISIQQIKEGESAVAPEVPVHYGYTFTGWDKSFENVTSDLTVTAQYEINEYTVTFIDYDGTVLDVQKVKHGKSVEPPMSPEREGYKFIGWDSDSDYITSDMTIMALYMLYGDVNCDDFIDSADATAILRVVAKLDEFEVDEDIADLNHDGIVDSADATKILRVVAKLETL